MKRIDEKLSTAAKVAIGALIYQQVKKMKADIKAAKDDAKKATDNLTRSEKERKDLKTKCDQLDQKLKDQKPQDVELTLQGKHLDQIRGLIRKEVGRILFDIYKLRTAWAKR